MRYKTLRTSKTGKKLEAVEKKAIGNSVVPVMAQKLIEELVLQNHQKIN